MLQLKTGSTLTINSKVYMPLSSKIIVERGARLYLNCAYVTSARNPINSLQIQSGGDYWDGIRVWGNTALPHLVDMYDPQSIMPADYAGRVITETSKIHHAKTAIATLTTSFLWPISDTYFGGFVYSIDTEFKNNRRAFAFMKYDFDNLGLIQGCDIISDNNHSTNGITMWAIKKFNIDDCYFSNLTKNGILGWDAHFTIQRSIFDNVHHGTETYSSTPLGGAMAALTNTFNNCDVGVKAENALSSQTLYNTFTSNDFGTAVVGDSRYLVFKNNFDNCGNGVNLMNTNFNGDNQIRCNTLEENELGILFLGYNEGSRFVFNNMDNSTANGDNVKVTHYAGLQVVIPGEIRFAQAWNNPNNPDVFQPAGNLFTNNFSSVREHIVTTPVTGSPNSSVEFHYHHSDPTINARVYPYCGIDGTYPISTADYKFRYTLEPGLFSDVCSRSVPGNCTNLDCYDELLTYYNVKATLHFESYN